MGVATNLLREELVMIDMDAKDANDAIGQLAKILYKYDFVKKSYINAVQEREKIFPTGLSTDHIGVAIPHTDVEHVNTPALAIAVLKKPVKFKMMGTTEKIIDVGIIFMLAIKEPKTQLEVLQKLMDIIQDQRLLKVMIENNSTSSLLELFERAI